MEEEMKEIVGTTKKEEATIFENLLYLIIFLKEYAIICDKIEGRVTLLRR